VREDALEDAEGALPPPDAASPLEGARRYIGAPYLWGGLTEAGIDCSGLVHMAYRRCGRLVPRDAWQQAEAGQRVDDPEPGDVAVYGDAGARPDHVAFWLGEGRILHATGRDDLGVVEEPEPPALRGRRRGFVRL
jgi:gamma-D-glutamyl-L-lysine dipeptidyl-peptidase